MNTNEIMDILVNEIHTVVMATNDKEGNPVTSVIDLMLTENEKIYFLTAKGKNFYERLMNQKFVSLSTWKGKDTMSSISISVRGKVKNIGKGKLSEIFDRNSYMKQIYPQEQSREALEVFELYEGEGEYFDLSRKPIYRESFHFGMDSKFQDVQGYFITDKCIGCGSCIQVCPQNCILTHEVPYVIESSHCLHCGNCQSVCPVNAVERGEVIR